MFFILIRFDYFWSFSFKEEHIFHAVFQAQLFVYNWQKVQAISLKDTYFIYNF